MMRRSTPNRSSSPLPAWIVFIILLVISVILWVITLYVWYQAHLWFLPVEQWTAIFTLLVPAAPFALYFWLYPAFARSYNNMMGVPNLEPVAPPPAATSVPGSVATPAVVPGSAADTGDKGDWISWLGRGERHRGFLVFWVILFGSIFYWSLVTWYFDTLNAQSFTTLFSAWGLLTTISTIMVRSLFVIQTSLPGAEVPGGPAEKKSAK